MVIETTPVPSNPPLMPQHYGIGKAAAVDDAATALALCGAISFGITARRAMATMCPAVHE
jgi:hypothetical protein